MNRTTAVIASLTALAVVASVAFVVSVLRDDPTSDAGPGPDDLLAIFCGLHEYQQDVSGYDLASEDDQNDLWALQVNLASGLDPKIVDAMDRADFAVRELLVGNEPNEEVIAESREVFDEECADVTAVDPDPDLYATAGCRVAEEWLPGGDLDQLSTALRFMTAAAVLDDDQGDLAAALSEIMEDGWARDEIDPDRIREFVEDDC